MDTKGTRGQLVAMVEDGTRRDPTPGPSNSAVSSTQVIAVDQNEGRTVDNTRCNVDDQDNNYHSLLASEVKEIQRKLVYKMWMRLDNVLDRSRIMECFEQLQKAVDSGDDGIEDRANLTLSTNNNDQSSEENLLAEEQQKQVKELQLVLERAAINADNRFHAALKSMATTMEYYKTTRENINRFKDRLLGKGRTYSRSVGSTSSNKVSTNGDVVFKPPQVPSTERSTAMQQRPKEPQVAKNIVQQKQSSEELHATSGVLQHNFEEPHGAGAKDTVNQGSKGSLGQSTEVAGTLNVRRNRQRKNAPDGSDSSQWQEKKRAKISTSVVVTDSDNSELGLSKSHMDPLSAFIDEADGLPNGEIRVSRRGNERSCRLRSVTIMSQARNKVAEGEVSSSSDYHQSQDEQLTSSGESPPAGPSFSNTPPKVKATRRPPDVRFLKQKKARPKITSIFSREPPPPPRPYVQLDELKEEIEEPEDVINITSQQQLMFCNFNSLQIPLGFPPSDNNSISSPWEGDPQFSSDPILEVMRKMIQESTQRSQSQELPGSRAANSQSQMSDESSSPTRNQATTSGRETEPRKFKISIRPGLASENENDLQCTSSGTKDSSQESPLLFGTSVPGTSSPL